MGHALSINRSSGVGSWLLVGSWRFPRYRTRMGPRFRLPRRIQMHQRNRVSRRPLVATGPIRAGHDLQDSLSAAPDRTDLERLFDRKVILSQILNLTGRG